MGEPLYEQVVGAITTANWAALPHLRPRGHHETLLAYLVRRLLENGANTSFVNRIADETIALDELVKSPVQVVVDEQAARKAPGLPHPRIPCCQRPVRRPPRNSAGWICRTKRAPLTAGRHAASHGNHAWLARPCWPLTTPQAAQPVRNPLTTTTWSAKPKPPPPASRPGPLRPGRRSPWAARRRRARRRAARRRPAGSSACSP